MSRNVPIDDDRTLITEAQRGDPAAFEGLVRRHDRAILRLLLGMVRSEDVARDLYQEVFLRVHRSLGRFRMESRFETWLYRIATNVCLDHLRRVAASGIGAPEGSAGGTGDDDRAATLADDRPDSDPERTLMRRESRRRIGEALQRLAPRERMVFELRHGQGLTARAIAEILSTSEETVRNCLYRAHRELRALLGDLRGGARAPVARVDPAEAGT
jgi:RNA polymerase sigma-70 factor, ECF subfamily